MPRLRSADAHPFLSPGFADDPYPVYRRLREQSPVLRLGRGDEQEVLVTGYEEVMALLRDDRASADRMRAPRLRRMIEAAPEALRSDFSRHSMLVRDDPAHARLRRLVNQAFTRRSVAGLEPRIRRIAARLLDEAARRGRFDAVADFAEPLAALVIAELVGVDGRDHERFRAWTGALLAGMLGGADAPDALVRAQRHLDGYWLELVRARRAAPRDDLVSHLIEARDTAGALSDRELLAMLNLILVAGHETSANLIGSTLWTLLRDPERWEAARSQDDASWSNLVEEMLRFESPIQGIARATTAETEVAGERLPEGAALTLMLGAANRDPRVFEAPERFDPARANARSHLAFGFGDHFCLGAALARSEAGIAVRSASERLPRLRLAEATPHWRRTSLLRGLESLPLDVQ